MVDRRLQTDSGSANQPFAHPQLLQIVDELRVDPLRSPTSTEITQAVEWCDRRFECESLGLELLELVLPVPGSALRLEFKLKPEPTYTLIDPNSGPATVTATERDGSQ